MMADFGASQLRLERLADTGHIGKTGMPQMVVPKPPALVQPAV
jgi:hypothetical protein